MNREQDLGKRGQDVMARMEEEGLKTSQRLDDWKKVEKIEADSARGGGGVGIDDRDRIGDRKAAKMSKEWLAVRLQLEHLFDRAEHLMDEAKGARPTMQWTPAQAEAEGWCGSHYRIGEQVPISKRPSGEPFFRGRCQRCGRWRDDNGDRLDPPLHVLEAWRDGRRAWRAA